MAENPLLPDAELRALLAHTRHCAALEAAVVRQASKAGQRSAASVVGSREALLAATTMQLQAGDLLLEDPTDTTALALAPQPGRASGSAVITAPTLPDLGKGSSRLLLAAAMAAALRAAGTDRLALAYVRAGAPQPGWTSALGWAQERLLPLLLVCADPSGRSAFRAQASETKERFTWNAVERAASRLKLPILSVDGEDAVAVYRVTQESVLRARAGGGPAILWAMLPSRLELKAGRPLSARPLKRLERYLRARHISA